MSKWIWGGKPLTEIPQGAYGFTYKIECMDTHSEFCGWYYIGQKSFWSNTNAKISKRRSEELWKGKGPKPKREKKTKESNWKKYCSSSKELMELIKELGEDKFQFTILGFACNKSDLNLMEVEAMVEYNVLRKENTFNNWLSFKILKSNVKC